jgi:hypothetical protein
VNAKRAPVISGDDATATQGHERGHSGKWQEFAGLAQQVESLPFLKVTFA